MKEIPNNPHEINSQPSTDAVMLQMMAQENMEEMEGSPDMGHGDRQGCV